MPTTNIVRHVSNTVQPKKILRLSVWWVPWIYKSSAVTRRERTYLEYSNESSKESLLARELLEGERAKKKVPKGYMVVYVGPEHRRFVIPMSYITMPEFRKLMDKMAEEFGFDQEGGLQIPCEVQDFEEILVKCFRLQRILNRAKMKK